MKHIIILIAILAISFTACNRLEIVSSELIDADTVYSPKYAKKFIILQKSGNTYLQVKNPWQGAAKTNKIYNITTAYKKIIAMSTSHLAFLDALDNSNLVCGVSGKNYVYSQSYNNTKEIGYDKQVDFEKILSLKPDVMFAYEVSGENSSIFQKLSSLGINIVYIADYLESDPLGRAEWIIAFGAMTGSIDKAKKYFNNVENNYNRIKQNIIYTNRNVILNSPYKDVWYFPSVNSYVVKLIKDAGCNYCAEEIANSNSSIPVGIETSYKFLQTSDVWINPSIGTISKKTLLDKVPLLHKIDIPLFNNDKRSTKYGGSDYYESGVTRPDLILKDLSMIFNYMGSTSEDSLYYYRQIF